MSSLITCQAHMILHFCYIANSYIYRVDILNGSVLHNLPGIRRYKFRNLHDFLSIIYLGFTFKEPFIIFLFLFLFKKHLTFLTDLKYYKIFVVVKGTVLIKHFILKGRVGSTVPVLHIQTWRQASDYISEPRSKVYNLDSIVMMYIILVNHVQLIAYNL